MIHQLFIEFKKAYDSFRRYYTILSEFGIPMEPVWLIKMCLNEIYSRVHAGKNLSDKFLSEWPEKRRCFITIGF
jgi:hypothetical protein